MSGAGEPLACVIGDMDLVRPLGLTGVRVAVVTAQPAASTRYTRFRAAVIEWPHPADDPEGAVRALIDFARAQPEKPVLFCQGDTDLLLASRHRDALAPHFHLTLAPAAMIEDLVDKLRFAALAERLSLPVAQTRVVRRGDPLDEVDFPFPAVLKPVTRRKWTGFGTGSTAGGIPKALRLESPAALRALAPAIERLETDFLLQQFVPGGENAIASYHAFVDPGGAIVAEFTGQKIRTYPRECGFTTALEITAAADVAAAGREVLRRVGYRGVVKVDFKRHAETGDLILLELNPRFNLWHHPGALAGVNLPYLAYCDATGRPRPAVGTAKPGLRWCWLWKDFSAFRAERAAGAGLSLGAWLRFALRAEAQSVLAWDDPAPFVRGVLLRSVTRRLMRPHPPAPSPRVERGSASGSASTRG